MNEITFQLESNIEIWDIIDKSVNNIFIHKYNPHEVIEWWKTTIRIEDNLNLTDLAVRNMEFDIKTDLNGLKNILQHNTNQLRIYQLNKPIPDTLLIEQLPEHSKNNILRQNGLEHMIWIDFEFISISSFNSEYIDSIRTNNKFAYRIKRNTGHNN